MQSFPVATSGRRRDSSRWTASCRARATLPGSLSRWPWRSITARLCLWWLTLSLGCGTGVGDQVTLVWGPSAGAQGYRLWQATASGPFLVASTVTSTTATAQANEASRFFVTAFNGGGESAPSNVVSYTPGQTPPPTVPPAPTGLTGQRINGSRLDLSWTSDPRYRTQVERATPTGAFSVIGTVAAGTMHFTTNAKKQEDWRYRVRSCGDAGCGEPGNVLYWPPQ